MAWIAGFIILLFVARRKDLTPIPRNYEQAVRGESRTQKVPVVLIVAIINVESGWNQDALGRDGEIGLMQILPATARWMGFSGADAELFDPAVNVHFGTKYLKFQLDRFNGSLDRAIAGYNAGTPRTRIDGKFTNQKYVDKVRAFL